MSSCVKPQANFYPLSKAVHQFNFPFTVQIIPTMSVPDFSTNKHHKVTLLSQQVISYNVLITKRNGVTTSVPMSDDDVQVVPLDNNLGAFYHTIGDVIRKRKTDQLEFVAVVSPCVHKGVVLDVGDILHLQPPTRMMTLQRNSNHHLRCVIIPGNRRVTLPDDFQIELRKCSGDVRETRVQQLSDVAYSEELPCLVTFPWNFNGFDGEENLLAGESVLLTGKSFNHVVIGCHRDSESESEDEIYIHTFPGDWMIDLEMLHGEQPVAEFSAGDLQEILNRIKGVKGVEKTHNKFSVDELDLPDYIYLSAREDVYENYDPKRPVKDPNTTGARDYTDNACGQLEDHLYEPANNHCRQQKTAQDENTKPASSGYKILYKAFTSDYKPLNDEEIFNNNNNNSTTFLATKSFRNSDKTHILAEMARQRRKTVCSQNENNNTNNSTRNKAPICYEVNEVKPSNPDDTNNTTYKPSRNSGYEINVINRTKSKSSTSSICNPLRNNNKNINKARYSGYEVNPIVAQDNLPPALPAKKKNYNKI